MTTYNGKNKGTVLVTGAAGGIGRATVQELARLGYTVVAGVRKPADAELLQRQSEGRVVGVLLDVTDLTSIDSAVAAVKKLVGQNGLTALINNAGIIVEGAVETVPIQALRQQFEVNVVGQIAVTQAFLPLLRLGGGRIINISAVTAKVAIPMLGPISASKAAFESLSDALRMEVKAWNIPVSIIEPAAMQTQIFAKSQAQADTNSHQMPDETRAFYLAATQFMREANAKAGASNPQVVVKTILQVLNARKPKTRYVVGKGARTLLTLRLLSDRTRDNILVGQMGLAKAAKIQADQ